MKYKQIYSDNRDEFNGERNLTQFIYAYYPDEAFRRGLVPPALICHATLGGGDFQNVQWVMVEATSEAHVIRHAIKVFDAMEVNK